MKTSILNRILVILILVVPLSVSATSESDLLESNSAKVVYYVQPGDLLNISVWREPELQLDVLVRPDGRFSMPLIGEIDSSKKSVDQLSMEIDQRISKYIPDVDVTVSLKEMRGNKIYVLGKVARSGEYVMNGPTDVVKALSMAGGMTRFAATDEIKVLRRQGGNQEIMLFNYLDIEDGQHLEQNIMLSSGDVVIVP